MPELNDYESVYKPTLDFLVSSRPDYQLLEYRVIDTGPCEPLAPADCDWGESDHLDNVPRRDGWSSWLRGWEMLAVLVIDEWRDERLQGAF